MKNILATIVVFGLCGLIVFMFFDNRRKNDLKKIEEVKSVCEDVIDSGVVYSLANNNTWYIFDLELIHEEYSTLYDYMEEKLGTDFDTRLSSGYRIVVAFNKTTCTYRVYLGGHSEEDMIYPEWNSKLMKEPK